MGGQTALNVGIELWRNEDLQRRGIRVLGTKIDAIVATEDREIFSTKLREINETLALSYPATTVEGALEAAHKIGYPVLVRAAFTLGGLGSGFAENDAELRDLAVRHLQLLNPVLQPVQFASELARLLREELLEERQRIQEGFRGQVHASFLLVE